MPLLKRIAGSEFCSDAHRREYQQEFSELALGRLMQANPSESQAQLLKAPLLASISAPPAAEEPPASAANGTHAAAKTTAPAWSEKARPAAPPVPAAKPNGIRKSAPAIPPKKTFLQPPASQPATAKAAASQPAIAKAAAIQKPAPAKLHVGLMAAPQFDHAFTPLAPDRPDCRPDAPPAELPYGRVVPCDNRIEIADSLARPIERKLDLREVPRQTLKITLDLRIVPPDCIRTESRTLTVTAAPAAPGEASLCVIPYCDFVGELVTLSDFADAQFSKSDFETPTLAEVSAQYARPEPVLPITQLPALKSEPPPDEVNASFIDSPIAALRPLAPVPNPQLNPLPISSPGIAPGRAKPLPVFGPVPIGSESIQVPQPNGLPLRPLIVLAAVSAPKPVKSRKSDVVRAGAAFPVKPTPEQVTTPLPGPVVGLPSQRIQDPAGASASRMRAIIAAAACAALLAAGILLFLSRTSDRSVRPTAAASADNSLGSQWVADFAPDARRQRRVSLLRSSMNLQSYRVEFESSIKIKALGWVSRAQDSKNFYVSKIEFQKPGVNPVYALVHYAVIDGIDQPRSATSLHLSVPMGGVYKIRFEAVGNHFATWVQGQRVEQWTDSRLSSGGAGLYSEGAEQSILHGDFVVTPLSKENESR